MLVRKKCVSHASSRLSAGGSSREPAAVQAVGVPSNSVLKWILRLFTAFSRWVPPMGEPSGRGSIYPACLRPEDRSEWLSTQQMPFSKRYKKAARPKHNSRS